MHRCGSAGDFRKRKDFLYQCGKRTDFHTASDAVLHSGLWRNFIPVSGIGVSGAGKSNYMDDIAGNISASDSVCYDSGAYADFHDGDGDNGNRKRLVFHK